MKRQNKENEFKNFICKRIRQNQLVQHQMLLPLPSTEEIAHQIQTDMKTVQDIVKDFAAKWKHLKEFDFLQTMELIQPIAAIESILQLEQHQGLLSSPITAFENYPSIAKVRSIPHAIGRIKVLFTASKLDQEYDSVQTQLQNGIRLMSLIESETFRVFWNQLMTCKGDLQNSKESMFSRSDIRHLKEFMKCYLKLYKKIDSKGLPSVSEWTNELRNALELIETIRENSQYRADQNLSMYRDQFLETCEQLKRIEENLVKRVKNVSDLFETDPSFCAIKELLEKLFIIFEWILASYKIYKTERSVRRLGLSQSEEEILTEPKSAIELLNTALVSLAIK